MSLKAPLADPARIQRAIEKLNTRIREIDAIDVRSFFETRDPAVISIESKIAHTLSETLSTSEWNRFMPRQLISLSYQSAKFTHAAELERAIIDTEQNISRARANLCAVIEVLEERLADAAATPQSRAAQAFGSMTLHPDIEFHCSELFKDGHYAQAVENACKVLEHLVKGRASRDDITGTALMQTVFSPKQPILRFNEQQNDSEQSEQQGMMYLYTGAIAALRNPRAHGLIEDHPEQALEYISFINMLAKALERTKLA